MDVRLRRVIGGALWMVGFGVAVVWGTLQEVGAEGRGYGFAPPVEVAALETGRVARIPMPLHALVRSGDVVVQLDPTPLQEERDWVEARLLAAREAATYERAGEALRRDTALARRAGISIRLQEDRAALGALQERLSVELDLQANGASSEQAVAEWRRQIRVAEAKVRAGQQALAALDAGGDDVVDLPTPDGSWEVLAASRELDMIEGRIERFDLRAGVDGQITWIYRAEGDVVPAGEPVLQVRKVATRDVVAFLLPAEVAHLEQGAPATVRRATGQVMEGRLVSVGSGPQALPASLWFNPQYPEYAVPVRIELEGEIGPDEPVTVRL